MLECPFSDVSTFYYKRNYNTYNFSIFSTSDRKGTCFVWHEIEAKRGSLEVVNCMDIYIKNVINNYPQVREIRFWSDNCSGQNKNRQLISYFYWASVKYGIKIIHRFMTKGHTMSEVDSIHSTIENRRKNREIFIPEQYVSLIQFAKVERPFYDVIKMDNKSFYDFTPLVQMVNLNAKHKTFKILKLKEIIFDGTPTILYKTEWQSNPEELTIFVKENIRGRKPKICYTNFRNWSPSDQMYKSLLPVSDAKFKDLTSLCNPNSPVIPEKYHSFYYSLPHSNVIEPLDDNG